MRLDENEGLALGEEYTGPLYEIERHTTVIRSLSNELLILLVVK